MELIRKAANNDGDYVTFQRTSIKTKILYHVDLYNSRTGKSLTVFSTEMSSEALGCKYIERTVKEAGMEVFNEACDFMGIESGLDE